MSTIEEVGRSMVEAINRQHKFKWKRASGEMCYKTVVASCTVVVRQYSFQILNATGAELDRVGLGYCGDDPDWIGEIWRHAHSAVLVHECVFEEILEDLELLGDDD